MIAQGHSHQRAHQFGFTLLEILVALMIFATAAVALTNSVTQSASSTSALEERQFADLLANNLLIDFLREGTGNKTSGAETLAGYDYRWEREISDTPHPDMRRVDIKILLQDQSDVLASRSAFLNR
ncbi:type II secretion system protein I [Spongiibacter sp. IMCC21906]|uniref:type II secretion system minor pseudopilin GspI n=1 Tax=Spongiibacter sp. IMCC21906 TaxID=1620392 RepID=UPI00062DDD44|nr:type II secretion system minor pseudopilin GspI [Spongiibacter sp. IMCC21906]AKH69487.1 type II secretion system protein I [Spongiibacter sp. IMCC21906]